MTFYSDKAALASKLLTKFGQDVIFSYETGATYDPVLMTETGGVASNETAKAFPTKFGKMEVSDTILSSDIKLLTEKLTTKPLPNWTCSINGTEYRVMNSDAVGLIGDEVIYYVQLRK
ncbi:MAG: hypothetical protein V7765_12725 [Oleispira sp.]|tara:strand:+ start:352 stop:705 length:354 start_codon:yes stop_codon:yes gene_type:complete